MRGGCRKRVDLWEVIFGLLNFCCTRRRGDETVSKGACPLCIPYGGEPSPEPPRTPRFRRKVGAFLQAGRFRWLRCYPPPAPSRAYTFLKEGAALAREGDFYFEII